VQRAILSATSANEGADGSNGTHNTNEAGTISLDLFSPEVAKAMEDWTNSAGVHRSADTASAGSGGGSPRNSGFAGKADFNSKIAGQGVSASNGNQAFPFDLAMTCSEPWRLMVPDVHNFHLTTQAIGALLTSRATLPAYAVALSLGGAS
jgi:hypothetical protein